MRILVVDDHKDTVDVLARVLKSFGHHVQPAFSIAEARQFCGSKEFDLLLCDIGLPDGDGWELAEVAREHGMHAIALTGHGMAADVQRSSACGFGAHLLKPILFEDLQKAIDRVAAK
jgi:CheY-like chemotaxis protein